MNERFMAALCVAAAAAGLVSLYFSIREGDSFTVFEVLTKLVTSTAMYMAFHFFKWDAAKGLMGGVLFCLMYQEAHLFLARLWGQQDFDTYLVAGVQGSIYLAAAGMAFLMTVIITINHFFINYSSRGNPKNVMLNQMAIFVKFIVYLLLFISNSQLSLPSAVLMSNGLKYFTDLMLLLLLICVEAQLDSFKVLRQELLSQKQEGRKRS